MSDRIYSEVPFEDERVRVIYDELGLITNICLDDICKILHRERMLGTDEMRRTCPSAIQLGEPSMVANMPWYAKPFDITRLTRKLAREGKIIASACENIEKWLATLPWGKANGTYEELLEQFDTVGVTRNTLEMEFKGHPVAFRIISNRLYVSATQMSHIYGQLPSTWLRRVDVMKWMEELVATREYPDLDAQVKTVKGKYGGTWIEEKLAIEFTKYLSEDLHKWYMGHLKTLLPHKYDIPQIGKTEVSSVEFEMPETMEEARRVINDLCQRIEGDRHKVEFYANYVEDREWFRSIRLADELEITPYRLHQFLMEQGICSYEKRQWIVKPKYQALQIEIPYLWTNAQGRTYAFGRIRRWTQAGREFILDLYRKVNS